MTDRHDHIVSMYTRHPISAPQILARLQAARGSLDALRPEELFALDQDHYGGLEANDALAAHAGLRPGLLVADFCAGLGGPARYLAHRYGVTVTGIELTPHRVAGATELTRRVGLQDRVRVLQGDVTAPDLADASQDAVVSQEAMLHVPDKAAALAQAWRVLRPGGRLVFTDWIAHRALAPEEADTLWQGLGAQTLLSADAYRETLRRLGFTLHAMEDLTAAWATILTQRLAMYRQLREETQRGGLPSGHDAFYAAYVALVELVRARALGGGRFVAEKPPR